MLDDMSKTADSKELNMTEMEDKVKELEKMLSEKSLVEEELEETKRRTSQLEGRKYFIWAAQCENVSSGICGEQRPRSDCASAQLFEVSLA